MAKSVQQMEWEANEFAACLLMPKEEFIEQVNKLRDSEGNVDVKKIAAHFGVTTKAAVVRGQVLNLWR